MKQHGLVKAYTGLTQMWQGLVCWLFCPARDRVQLHAHTGTTPYLHKNETVLIEVVCVPHINSKQPPGINRKEIAWTRACSIVPMGKRKITFSHTFHFCNTTLPWHMQYKVIYLWVTAHLCKKNNIKNIIESQDKFHGKGNLTKIFFLLKGSWQFSSFLSTTQYLWRLWKQDRELYWIFERVVEGQTTIARKNGSLILPNDRV